jgi:1-acyl-sn-glycerol-3-phosphate acyltransferase
VPRLRATLRLLAIALVTAIVILSWLGPLALRPFSARAAARLRAKEMRAWARAMLAIANVRVTLAGSPPPRPCLLVSNHLSYLDIPVFWSAVECTFLAKSDVARWPLLGPLTRASGTLYIERERRTAVAPALDAVRARLTLGERVVVFPEGSSSPGAAIQPFRSSLFAAADATGNRVWTAAISYDTGNPSAPAHLRVAWWGDMTFPDHIWRLVQIPRTHARVHFGAHPVVAADRKQLARAAHSACSSLFTPTAPPA